MDEWEEILNLVKDLDEHTAGRVEGYISSIRDELLKTQILQLPDRWQQKIAEYVRHTVKYMDTDFIVSGLFITKSVKLTYKNGTECLFKDAYCLEDVKHEEILIMTEHLGFHIFSMKDGLEYENIFTPIGP